MKKMLAVVALVLAVGVARADTYTYTYSATCGAAAVVSAALPVSGWLDRIEVGHAGAAQTSTVIVATYDAAGTAINTMASLTACHSAVVIPRAVPTTTAGVALTSTFDDVAPSNMTLAVTAPYERIMGGGNLKCSVAGLGVAGATNVVSVTFFFEPLKK